MQFLCYVTFSNADSRISIFFRNFERILPPEHGSDLRETLAKRVSDDLQLFIFWRWNFFLDIGKNLEVDFCFQETGVLEELWISERQWQVSRKKLLPELPLFLGRLPWRRGKGLNTCREPRLGTENDFNHLVLWYSDIMIVW